MSALLFDRAGEPREVLRFAPDWSVSPSPDEALVEVIARPIQPADYFFIRGRYRVQPRFPQPAGLEGVGIIASAPADSGFAKGDRVAFRAPGSWASVASVPTDRLLAVPPGIADHLACQVSLNPVTAYGLLAEAKVKAGDWVVLTAATSTVAGLIAAVARARGIRTIGIARGAVAVDDPRIATDLVVAADADVADAIREAVGGDQVAAVIDSVGGPMLSPLFGVLRPGGHIVAYGVMDPNPVPVANATLIYGNLIWSGFGIDRWLASQSSESRARMMEEVWTLLGSGAIVLPVAGQFELPDFIGALAADSQPRRNGKVVLI